MDENKVRVQFYAGDGVLPYKLAKPIYIPAEDYIRIRMAEHRNDSTVLRDYIKNVLLKGTPVTLLNFSMSTAVGNPAHVLLIDQAIAEGRNPLDKPENDDEYSSGNQKEEEDNTPGKLDNIIIKYYPKWEEFSKKKRECVLIASFVLMCIIILCMIGIFYDEEKKTQEERIENVKDNAEDVWNNIKSIGDN